MLGSGVPMRLLISSSHSEAPFSSAPKGCLRMASGPSVLLAQEQLLIRHFGKQQDF